MSTVLIALHSYKHSNDQDEGKEQDTGLGESEQWRFTPSMLDTNSFAFTAFANQHSEGFTPTPAAAMSDAFHNQAGDLHTPSMGFGLETPLSMSNSDGQNNSTISDEMHAFHPHLLQSQTFHSPNMFTQQQSYAPSSFVHQDSGYETLHNVQDPLSANNIVDSQHHSPYTSLSVQNSVRSGGQPSHDFEKWV